MNTKCILYPAKCLNDTRSMKTGVSLTVSLDLIQYHINNNKCTSSTNASTAVNKYRSNTRVGTARRGVPGDGLLSGINVVQEIQNATWIGGYPVVRPCLCWTNQTINVRQAQREKRNSPENDNGKFVAVR